MKSGRSQNEKRQIEALEKSHQACSGAKSCAATQQRAHAMTRSLIGKGLCCSVRIQ
jgi:hypothetical protein